MKISSKQRKREIILKSGMVCLSRNLLIARPLVGEAEDDSWHSVSPLRDLGTRLSV